MSILSGVIGDDTITCYDAVRVGKRPMNSIVNLIFADVKLSRKDRTFPISSASSSIKVNDERVVVDPTISVDVYKQLIR